MRRRLASTGCRTRACPPGRATTSHSTSAWTATTVGALDAFVDGGERTVDLAEINGRVFVNNVSLGLYAEAVQREGYRDAKIRTLLDTVPDMSAPAVASSTCAGRARAGTNTTRV